MNVFFNTQTQAPRCCLQITGEMILTPVRFWLGGRTIQEVIRPVAYEGAPGGSYAIIKECHQVEDLALIASRPDYWEKPWAKTVMPSVIKIAMAILFLPGLVLGSAFKLVAHGNCIFPCILKPVIVQQYKYHSLVDGKAEKFPPLSSIIADAQERTYCSLDGRVVELLQKRHLSSKSLSEDTGLKVIHCQEDIAIDDGYHYGRKTFYFNQGYIVDSRSDHFNQDKIPRSFLVQTMSTWLWSCWNPKAAV